MKRHINMEQGGVIAKLEEFKEMCDVIVCKRMVEEMEDVREKVYTRDL